VTQGPPGRLKLFKICKRLELDRQNTTKGPWITDHHHIHRNTPSSYGIAVKANKKAGPDRNNMFDGAGLEQLKTNEI
jgi:hypothetical protein